MAPRLRALRAKKWSQIKAIREVEKHGDAKDIIKMTNELISPEEFTHYVQTAYGVDVVWKRDYRKGHKNPEVHYWDGEQFVWFRKLYREGFKGISSLIHELSHYIECLHMRPQHLNRPNWALDEDAAIGWYLKDDRREGDAKLYGNNATALLYERTVIWTIDEVIRDTLMLPRVVESEISKWAKAFWADKVNYYTERKQWPSMT